MSLLDADPQRQDALYRRRHSLGTPRTRAQLPGLRNWGLIRMMPWAALVSGAGRTV